MQINSDDMNLSVHFFKITVGIFYPGPGPVYSKGHLGLTAQRFNYFPNAPHAPTNLIY